MYDIKLSEIDTIVFDFDETLVQSIFSVLFTANYLYDFGLSGKEEIMKSVRKWNLEDVLIGVSKKQVEATFENKMFFDLLEPYTGMIEAMKWLKSKGKKNSYTVTWNTNEHTP